jgi:hypothetical protein
VMPMFDKVAYGCGPGSVEKEKWRNLLLTKANRR